MPVPGLAWGSACPSRVAERLVANEGSLHILLRIRVAEREEQALHGLDRAAPCGGRRCGLAPASGRLHAAAHRLACFACQAVLRLIVLFDTLTALIDASLEVTVRCHMRVCESKFRPIQMRSWRLACKLHSS